MTIEIALLVQEVYFTKSHSVHLVLKMVVDLSVNFENPVVHVFWLDLVV